MVRSRPQQQRPGHLHLSSQTLTRSWLDPCVVHGLKGVTGLRVEQRVYCFQSPMAFLTERVDSHLCRNPKSIQRHFVGRDTWLIATLR